MELEILFRDRTLAKRANDTKALRRQYGDQRARLIRRRLDELSAANVLEEMRSLPGARCHELKGDREGQLSVALDHPYRLIFEALEPRPLKTDGGLDWTQVVAIIVTEIVDYHGE